MIRAVLYTLLTLSVLYVAVGLLLRAVQAHLLFPAPAVPRADLTRMAQLAGATELSVPSEGETLYGWHRPASGTHAVLYFHGNASHAAVNVLPMRAAHEAGWDFICISPRGYPGSSGKPTPGFLRADALAAWAHATEVLGFAPSNIVLHGRSLGGGMVGELMGSVQPGGFVIESSFRSMAALVQEKIPVWPMGLILQYPLRTIGRAGSVSAPVLVLHGDADEMIPVAHGRALGAAFPTAEYVEVAGKGHNDGLLQDPVASAVMRAWLDARR